MSPKKSKKKKEKAEEKVYTIPLREIFHHPKTKRASKAIKKIKKFLSRKIKEEIKLERSLSNEIWKRGREAPPRKIKVKVSEGEGLLKASLAE